MQNRRFATEIARKHYQILLNPGTKLIPLKGLRNIRASDIGHLVRFRVIMTNSLLQSLSFFFRLFAQVLEMLNQCWKLLVLCVMNVDTKFTKLAAFLHRPIGFLTFLPRKLYEKISHLIVSAPQERAL